MHGMSFHVDAQISDFVREMDKTPSPDYPKELKTWFFSKPWSLPFWIVIVGLPALVGYVTMIKTVLGWIGIDK
jgi:hypothetical protein